jgi:hypothetical protein
MTGALYDPSPAALRPLMETFWCAQGWRRERAWPDADVMEQAVRAGFMFADPLHRDHDGWVSAARDACREVSPGEVAGAFLASLTTRRLDLRSALGTYAVARHLPEHPFATQAGDYQCVVCGLSRNDDEPDDANVLSFERFKWGGVRRTSIIYIAFDLEQFARAPRLTPTPADIAVGQQVIDQLRALPPDTTAAQAVPCLKMIRGNKAERDILIDILGVCGILQTPQHHGYARSFIRSADRDWPPQRYVFGSYPTCWWKAADGINTEALHQFLPQLQ